MQTTRKNANSNKVTISPLAIAKQQHIEKIIFDLFDTAPAASYRRDLKKLLTIYKYTAQPDKEKFEDIEPIVNSLLEAVSKLEETGEEFKILEA